MIAILSSLLAVIFYSIGMANQLRAYLGKTPQQATRSLIIGFFAAGTHFLSNFQQISGPTGLDLSLLKSASLVTNIIVVMVLILIQRKPIHNLLLVAYPLATASLLAALTLETPSHWLSDMDIGLLIHICLSIAAYAVFSIATIQAILLYAQNRQLKTHVTSRLIRSLPPLQTMESILFEIIWVGMILLTLAIVSGAIFMDDLFAQHLVHKTVLSLCAWAIFATLLAGRHFYGWRGVTASRWTIGGSILLMLGYFGSKLVLELILKRA